MHQRSLSTFVPVIQTPKRKSISFKRAFDVRCMLSLGSRSRRTVCDHLFSVLLGMNKLERNNVESQRSDDECCELDLAQASQIFEPKYVSQKSILFQLQIGYYKDLLPGQ